MLERFQADTWASRQAPETGPASLTQRIVDGGTKLAVCIHW